MHQDARQAVAKKPGKLKHQHTRHAGNSDITICIGRRGQRVPDKQK